MWNLSQRRLVPEWHLFPDIAEAACQWCNELEVDLLASSHTNQCQHYYILENPLPLGALGLNAFNHLGHSGDLCISSLCIGSPSSVHISGRTCHMSFQTNSGGTLLD